jgi:hypothetical protein
MAPSTHFLLKYLPRNDSAMRRKQPRQQPTRKRRQTIADRIEAMAARGEPEDLIALKVNLSKNSLRRRHILHIRRGRAAKVQGAAMTRAEMCCASAILASFDSEWFDPAYGNDLWPGLAGDNAKTAADAYARWLRDGGRLITSGIGKNFGPERIAKFCKLKA